MFSNEFDKKLKECGLKRTFGYNFYFKNYIFDKIILKNKKLLDLGGGNGVASFFAYNSERSCKCTIVDPYLEGSNKRMSLQNKKLSKIYNNAVRLHNDYIDTLPENYKFDIILMHNSINHIGEDIIGDIDSNKNSQIEYSRRLSKILERANANATLIIADCSSKNFWNDLKIKNFLAPTIDWNLHKPPNVWKNLIENLGFEHISTKWRARRELLSFGKFFLSNVYASYMLNSFFVSIYKKK
jgi:hypothetical protein